MAGEAGGETGREPPQSRSGGTCPFQTTSPHPRNGKVNKSDDRPWAAPPTPLSSYDFHRLLHWGRGWLLWPVEMPGGDTRGRGLSQALAIIPERSPDRLAFPPARGMKSQPCYCTTPQSQDFPRSSSPAR